MTLIISSFNNYNFIELNSVMTMNQTKKIYLLMILIIIVRLFTVMFIDKIPCMEDMYYEEGQNFFAGNKICVSLSPFYSVIVYVFTTLFGSLKVASVIIYVIGSSAIVFYLSKIALLLFNEHIAVITIVIALFFPNLTVAVAGYSHSVVLGNAFEFAALFYFICFFKYRELRYVFVGSVLAVITIAIRPETIFVISAFLVITISSILIFKERDNYLLFLKAFGIYLGIIILFVFAHQQFVSNKSLPNNHPGIFTDDTYSYFTFTDTYSIIFAQGIDHQVGVEKSIPYIGTPEQNDFKISKAILKNPKQFLSNVSYMCKELLKIFAHPLFIPFFYYFFIGIMLFNNSDKLQLYKYAISILTLLLALHLVPLVIFHVEIRYMQQLCLLSILLIAFNLSLLQGKTYKISMSAILVFTFIIYAVYLIANREMASLCG